MKIQLHRTLLATPPHRAALASAPEAAPTPHPKRGSRPTAAPQRRTMRQPAPRAATVRTTPRASAAHRGAMRASAPLAVGLPEILALVAAVC
eukprot:6181592-Pleurochrysis_carterae.AAC.3